MGRTGIVDKKAFLKVAKMFFIFTLCSAKNLNFMEPSSDNFIRKEVKNYDNFILCSYYNFNDTLCYRL